MALKRVQKEGNLFSSFKNAPLVAFGIIGLFTGGTPGLNLVGIGVEISEGSGKAAEFTGVF